MVDYRQLTPKEHYEQTGIHLYPLSCVVNGLTDRCLCHNRMRMDNKKGES